MRAGWALVRSISGGAHSGSGAPVWRPSGCWWRNRPPRSREVVVRVGDADAQHRRIRARLVEAGAPEWEVERAATLDELLRLSGAVGNRPLGTRTSLRAVAV